MHTSLHLAPKQKLWTLDQNAPSYIVCNWEYRIIPADVKADDNHGEWRDNG